MRHTIILFTVLLLAACDSGERQRLQLEELERMNRADSVMLNDSLARDLADWFDRHGTRNEQLRAYYMLGRTYADRGEVPQALEAYNDAADRADTTAANCDYRTLSRIYAQTAQLYCNQLLPDHMIRYEKLAMKYAMEAKDTMCYLGCFAMLGEGYELKNDTDSSLVNLLEAYQLYKGINAPELAASLCCSIANIYIQKHNYTKAAEFLHEYETCSGFFNDNGDVESVKGMYYYFKGLWCLNTSDKVNAEFFFRKLNTVALTYDQKIAAFDGLHALYQSSFNKDSLVKYSRLRDSLSYIVHNEIEMQKTLQMQAMYDYSHHQQVAQQEKERADRERMHFWSLVFYVVGSIIALSILAAIVFAALLHQRKKALKHYYIKVEELKAAQHELRQLLQRSSESEMLISKKEQEIQRLQSELDDTMKNRQLKRDKEKFQMEESGIGQLLRRKAASGTKLTEEEWARINQFISESMPEFDAFLSSKAEILGIQWMRICILFRLFVIEKNVGTMLGVSAPFISSECKKINSKLFFVEGSGKVLARELLKI